MGVVSGHSKSAGGRKWLGHLGVLRVHYNATMPALLRSKVQPELLGIKKE